MSFQERGRPIGDRSLTKHVCFVLWIKLIGWRVVWLWWWQRLGCAVIIWWLHCECWCWQLPSTKFGCHRPRLISHTIRTFPQTVREAGAESSPPAGGASQLEISTAPKQTSNKPMAEISDHITTGGTFAAFVGNIFYRKQSLKGNKMCILWQ